MFVYFIVNGICKRTTHVYFDLEKCAPCVGTYTDGSIDPALWYKVLALDSILVDCDYKVVSWTCEKCDADLYGSRPGEKLQTDIVRDIFKNKERLNRENVDLNPALFELFDTATVIFHSLAPDGNATTYTDIFKILHVYILPEVRFQQKHTGVMQQVLRELEKEFENIEMLVEMNAQSRRNDEDQLAKQRRYLLSVDGVSRILYSQSSDDEFIKLLVRHAKKDIRKIEDILIMLSNRITPLRNATDETSVKLLADTRAERDRVVKEKESIILACGELNFDISRRKALMKRRSMQITVRRSQSVRPENISDKFEQYKRETTVIEKLNNDIKQHINMKIRMSSVREAVVLTLKEIETDAFSFGYSRKKGSLEIEADLFDPTKKPKDWTTLHDHVQTFLQTNKLDSRTRHEEFCTRIKKICKAITEKSKRDFLVNNNHSSLKNGRPFSTVGASPLDQDASMSFTTRWLFGSVPKEDCEALCKQISEHITYMADEVARQIQGSNDNQPTFHTHVYICYEELVSDELMPMLSKLYEQSFRMQCETLWKWVKGYSETELDSINTTLEGLFPDTIGKGNYLQDLNTRFTSAFEEFYSTIRQEDASVSIFSKLHQITRAVQSAQRTVAELRIKNGQNDEICTDDILDILILLICRLDHQDMLKLYAHTNLILNLSPYFLKGNINEYSAVTLTAAYQHLFSQQEMHTSVQTM